MSRRAALIALGGVAAVAAGFGLGVGTAHWTQRSEWPVLSPSSMVPRNQAAVEQRAIGLVAGMTRAGDGLTFDAWIRMREGRLHPGVTYGYEAQLDGNDACGFWRVIVMPHSGTVQPQPVATVDETTEVISGDDEHSAYTVYYDYAARCERAMTATGTWLDQFRAGSAP